jgi:peptide alpha-N-acetyltransferase
MLNFYDEKMYDKGMKNCEEILEKYPQHPESLAMKALFLAGQKRNKDAFDLIKVILMKHMTNFSVWHVYGMLNKNQKDYDMALKSYKNAIKIGGGNCETNEGVFRDLSVL